MLVFDIDLIAKINGDKLEGFYIKNYDPDFKLPFRAVHGETFRFTNSEASAINYSGKYQLTFVGEKETYRAIGVLNQNGNQVTGTFLTPTGDYRYLQGNVVDGKLKLSTFDGNHAFLFAASLEGDSLKGDFYSGKLSHEIFKGVRNETAFLKISFLKGLRNEIAFFKISFPNPLRNEISFLKSRVLEG